ncbi:MAG TPA: hypothetical protein VNQ77_05540 [Frankiaceae bacterium]|nr:hypothetical protein [Frankiaceae bacterium]
MTRVLLLAAVVAILAAAAGWAWHAAPFTRAGLRRRLVRPEFWEQVLAGRDHAAVTVFGPVADDAMQAARSLGYDVDEPATNGSRTTFTVRRG